MKTVAALVAAILVPTLLMTGWYLFSQFVTFAPDDPYIWIRTRGFLLICFAISAAYVIVLGIPTFLLLRWRKAIFWWTTMLSGFVLGAIPMAIVTWPLRYGELKASATIDGIQTLIGGVPTLAGWVQYAEGLSFMGAWGFVGAMAFWLVWRSGRNNSSNAAAAG